VATTANLIHEDGSFQSMFASQINPGVFMMHIRLATDQRDGLAKPLVSYRTLHVNIVTI
jgi:hypothetical protein